MKLTENAEKVLEKRYLAKNEKGEIIETPDDMFRRVAKAIAQADKDYVAEDKLKEIEEEFYNVMTNLEFLPNSPTLMNAGMPLGMLSACFVLPIEDSMEGIFDAIKNTAMIHRAGGGTGFSFSRLRPEGSMVSSTGGVSSGPISFMKVFNAATEAVKQGGKRRGANLGLLRVDHPDILKFIDCKQDNADITNFNISVGITDEFMEAVENDEEYDLICPHKKEVTGQLKAREVFEKIIDAAWKNGEPGVIFIDKMNADNPTPEFGDIESPNPCAEQPLLPYESCVLGSINLSTMIKNGAVDYDKIKKTVKAAVRFLDNVIDVNKYPLPEIEFATKRTRKIGLGVMGWADLLCKLHIPYNSERAVALAMHVMEFINEEAFKYSRLIAWEKGAYSGKRVWPRNATCTTIAPTGTLSIIAGCSSGIEPLFGLAYIKNVMDGTELAEVNPIFLEAIEGIEFDSPSELMNKIVESGTIQNIDEIPEGIRNNFVTAHDISPEWHVRMQAAFQKYTDNAVSKTVNLPHDAIREDVKEVYELAYELGCKGVTVYRDGSRENQVLNIGKVNKSEVNEVPVTLIAPRPRPDTTTGFTEKVKIGCGNLYVTVNYDDKGICEVFTNTGRSGGCPSQSEAISRLISLNLRSGVDTKEIVEQLKGIRCPSTIRQNGLKVLSCPDAIGRLIEKVGNNETKTDIKQSGEKCPECGEILEHEGGCVICRNCGHSKCN